MWKFQTKFFSFITENGLVESQPPLTLIETLTEFEPVTVDKLDDIMKSSSKAKCAIDFFDLKLLTDATLLTSFAAYVRVI